MKYYIFKVTNNKGKTYYKLNNRYIGYIDFDSDQWRAKMERLSNPPIEEVSYQVFASGEVENHTQLHRLFADSKRFGLFLAKKIAAAYALNISKDRRKYRVHQPSKNSSYVYLKEIGGKATIK
jgi:hypothetical protein